MTFQLDRFVVAQAPVYDTVVRELQAGRKQSHWMWFIFPQLKGLGRSPTSSHFGVAGAAEAYAYLRHPILGPRLKACTRLVMATEESDALAIFGAPDDLKFHSSMTLFAMISRRENLFQAAIDRFFAGEPDRLTLDLIGKPQR